MPGDATLRARRLERLRALDRNLRLATELAPAPFAAPSLPEERAVRIAAAVGGRVAASQLGAVVIAESRMALPFDPAPLARLPYLVDPSRRLLLLDAETTGLGTAAGTVAFLVGLGWWEGDAFVVRQLWLPDHGDEPALLAALVEEIATDAWLVTYNGRAFDWPLLVTRFRLHRCAPPALAGHLDLLPIARQLWRHRLPDARLTSVAAGVAGVRRSGDLPGALVPERYFAVLRGAPAHVLQPVAAHNRADVVAMAYLLRILALHLADPAARRSVHPGDLAALGRAWRSRGRLVEAVECLGDALAAAEAADAPHSVDRDLLALERARLLGRLGRRHDARDALGSLARRGGRIAVLAGIALAIQLEHRERDLEGALVAARRAAELQRRQRAMGLFLPQAERDLPRRLARLERRLGLGVAAAPRATGC